ncbi:MAG: hypothetical protein HZA72_00690 [Candidatus Omnitrophica bacterium]|nr:hypothetical protein [Candidatus Omnitrophota bacterium]
MIITVSGSSSGVGKTKLVQNLLKVLKGWSAIKVTVVKDGACPRKAPCGVCESQKRPFTIITASRIIGEKGKDTYRMKMAGAKKTLWLKAKPAGLKEGITKALKKLKGSPGIIIEGTSVLKHLRPDLGLYVDRNGETRIIICS